MWKWIFAKEGLKTLQESSGGTNQTKILLNIKAPPKVICAEES